MSDKAIKIIQITDCHLGETEGDKVLSTNPDASLTAVLALINQQHPTADLLVATGDLANEPSLPTYQRLYHLLAHSISYPFSWLPGNHDAPQLMSVLGERVNVKVHVFDAWVIILVNSCEEGCTHGYLSEAELQFLDHTLQEHSDKYAMICLHHHPVAIGSQWMDHYMVRNAQDFWQLIDQHPHVNIVLWGHVHQAFSQTYKRTALLASPSTCVQFAPGKKEFCVDNAMPGYRWLELYADGSYESGVERLVKKAETNNGAGIGASGYA
jgi:Icc protein